jgi:SAM-dependent methyltransferase
MYFNEQVYTTQKFVIPYINAVLPITKNIHVLEVGCGEAGNLKPFVDIGCRAAGVDLNKVKVEYAKQYYSNHQNKNVELVVEDIYHMVNRYKEEFDLVFLRDVIEHIHDQKKFMNCLKGFLKPDGKVFFGFPPWQNPFGGHQQICENKLLSKLPYFHLLPKSIYKLILKAGGEKKSTIKELLEIKDTGISIERFEKILKTEGWKIYRKTFYFINPNYEIKFGIQPRETMEIIAKIPILRNFFTTAVYYIAGKN